MKRETGFYWVIPKGRQNEIDKWSVWHYNSETKTWRNLPTSGDDVCFIIIEKRLLNPDQK